MRSLGDTPSSPGRSFFLYLSLSFPRRRVLVKTGSGNPERGARPTSEAFFEPDRAMALCEGDSL